MKARYIFMVVTTIIMIGAVLTGLVLTTESHAGSPQTIATLSNVRDYASAPTAAVPSYAVDGGQLFVGAPMSWRSVSTPENVIVNAVAIDSANPETVYIGAANEMAIYRSTDGGQRWLRTPLSAEYIGGVTDIAVDSAQRLVYVGTDTGGLYRLRDVGASMVLSGQLLLDEPVRQVVADSTGAGLAFARTDWNLYRAENFGLSWVTVGNLHSSPTAVAIANTTPATIYVGTMDRGVLKSQDGLTWALANEGLGFVPGSRLSVNALTVDPSQPDVVYIATSYLYGSTELHSTPRGVAISTDGGSVWSPLSDELNAAVVELLAVTGETGAVYALTSNSRTPVALGVASTVPVAVAATPAETLALALAANPSAVIAWVIAGLAAMALVYAVVTDVRRRTADAATVANNALETQTIHIDR